MDSTHTHQIENITMKRKFIQILKGYQMLSLSSLNKIVILYFSITLNCLVLQVMLLPYRKISLSIALTNQV